MNKLFCKIFFTLCFITGTMSFAQTPDKKKSPAEVLRWKADLAESAYGFDPTHPQKERYLFHLERLTENVCFPGLHQTFAHSPEKNTPGCLELIKKVLTLFKHDPVVTCAQNGINSSQCKTAYEEQITRIEPLRFPEHSSSSSLSGISGTRIEPKNRSHSRIRNRKEKKPEDEEDFDHEHLEKQLLKDLQLSCRMYEIRLVEKEEQQVRGKISLSDLLNQSTFDKSEATTPTPEPEIEEKFQEEETGSFTLSERKKEPEKQWKRIRVISSTCNRILETYSTSGKRPALAVCYREGFYTPLCIDALEKEKRERPKGKTGSPASGEDGIERF